MLVLKSFHSLRQWQASERGEKREKTSARKARENRVGESTISFHFYGLPRRLVFPWSSA